MAKGPYRRRPLLDPEVKARLEQALSAARQRARLAKRARRRFTWLAVLGYLGAAMMAGSTGDDAAGAGRGVALTSVAVGATYALLHAGRAGSRGYDLEAEIAGLEQLSEALARGTRG
jgi:hypothetical protein